MDTQICSLLDLLPAGKEVDVGESADEDVLHDLPYHATRRLYYHFCGMLSFPPLLAGYT